MGSLWFNPETLAVHLSETAGYESGRALSLDQMCDQLADTGHADTLITAETHVIRIRSEELEDLFGNLLYRIGYTDKPFTGDTTGIGLFSQILKAPTSKQSVGISFLSALNRHTYDGPRLLDA